MEIIPERGGEILRKCRGEKSSVRFASLFSFFEHFWVQFGSSLEICLRFMYVCKYMRSRECTPGTRPGSCCSWLQSRGTEREKGAALGRKGVQLGAGRTTSVEVF